MTSPAKFFATLFALWRAERAFTRGRWTVSRSIYQSIQRKMRGDSSSIVSIKVCARLFAIYVALDDHAQASRQMGHIIAKANSSSALNRTEKDWIFVHIELLCDTFDFPKDDVPSSNELNLNEVSDRIREDFPLERFATSKEFGALKFLASQKGSAPV